MFSSIIDNTSSTITVSSALICTLVSIVLGVVVSLVYMFSSKEHTKNFIITLALLPVLVQAVIMMVSGNLGTSVAVLGTFSLVRFRSTPGTSKEILAIFLAMALGLATGMGQIAFAAMMAVVVCIFLVVFNKTKYGETSVRNKVLKVTLPEDLDYNEIFDDVFLKYTKKVDLETVKTTNMGSLYELKYNIEFNKDINEKAFIDEIRCRNGNLNIILARQTSSKEDL